MKTAYELAMERLGGSREYSPEQKARLAEIDRVYEAHRAEAKLAADQKLAKAGGDREKQDEIREHLARDLRRFDEKQEAEKEKIRAARGK